MFENQVIMTVLLNFISILVIALIVVIWRAKQPMTAKKLIRTVKKLVKPTQHDPYKDDFCKKRMMLEFLEQDASNERTICSLLIDWYNKKYISLEKTPKKKLKSFGEENQNSIVFLNRIPKMNDGAEKMLFDCLSDLADETDILQESELYQTVRSNHTIILQRIEQFEVQGKHSLRASGDIEDEKKSKHFGLDDSRRTIFTQKGIRNATELLGYKEWVKESKDLDKILWYDAVLLEAEYLITDNQLLLIAKSISKAIVSAVKAGEESQK